MRWRPLLTGLDAAAAHVAAAYCVDRVSKRVLSGVVNRVGLSEGLAGMFVSLAYAQQCRPRPHGLAVAEATGRLIGTQLAVDSMTPGLFSGFSGAVAALRATRLATAPLAPMVTAGIDDTLLACIAQPDRYGFDLVSGVVGIAAAALHHGSTMSGGRVLAACVSELERTCDVLDEGCLWRTATGHMPAHRRTRFPNGYYDLGMAHGVAGVVSFLAICTTYDIAGSAKLCRAATDGLLAHRLKMHPRFPSLVAPNGQLVRSRIAWCYGDLGIAVALLHAARALNDPSLWRLATSLAVDCAQKPIPSSDRVEAGFCHGLAGIAHLFNRVAQLTGDQSCDIAARTLVHELVQRINRLDAIDPQDDSLITGWAGIGAVLVASVSPFEPFWDALFLVGAPPLRTSP